MLPLKRAQYGKVGFRETRARNTALSHKPLWCGANYLTVNSFYKIEIKT